MTSSKKLSRRTLLRGAAAAGAAMAAPPALGLLFGGLRRVQAEGAGQAVPGYGPLIKDPQGLLDLPKGFRYVAFSREGETMSDGFFVPGAHDGMAAFPGPDGATLVVRNHELDVGGTSPFGHDGSLAARVPQGMAFDPGTGGKARCLGGTTTLTFDTKEQRLVEHHLSLVGTLRNCAGGPTPWGSWVTCEEGPLRASDHEALTVDHGWCFEVPAAAKGLVKPVPLKAMGRFNHEAIAVHEPSGVIYLTEDRADGLFYRFIPQAPGKLVEGGRLEALGVVDRPGLYTGNTRRQDVRPGEQLAVRWIPLDDVEAPREDLRVRGRKAGAASFVRGEGIIARGDEVFFVCTSGGPKQRGQVWRYSPSPKEGTSAEVEAPSRLELFVEPADAALLDNGDNIAVSPGGDLVLCEDGPGENGIVGVTPEGGIYRLARNALNDSEMAGATPSPDGSTLFVNIQRPGITLAITGPWKDREG